MSGGHYDYNQYRLNDLYSQLKEDVARRKRALTKTGLPAASLEEEADQKAIIKAYEQTLDMLKMTGVMTERADYLESDDDGPDSFMERAVEELSELTLRTKEGKLLQKKMIDNLIKIAVTVEVEKA